MGYDQLEMNMMGFSETGESRQKQQSQTGGDRGD